MDEKFDILNMLDFISRFEDYTQTSENKLSSTRTWFVNLIRCNQKIHRHLEMPVVPLVNMAYNVLAYLVQVRNPRIIKISAKNYCQIL